MSEGNSIPLRPFEEHGHYTVVHDSIIDIVMPYTPPNAFKILMFILRKARDLSDKVDPPSHAEIKEGTGIKSNDGVTNALRWIGENEDWLNKTAQLAPDTLNLLGSWGYAYLVECMGVYKIGRSIDPQKRLRALRTGTLAPATLLASKKYRDTPRQERALHLRYADKRSHGEWFELISEEVDEVKKFLS